MHKGGWHNAQTLDLIVISRARHGRQTKKIYSHVWIFAVGIAVPELCRPLSLYLCVTDVVQQRGGVFGK